MADMFRPIPVDQEPKLKNRFVLEFPTELGINSYVVQTAKKPSMTLNKVEIPSMNTSTWTMGRYIWDEMDIEFIDPIGPSSTQKITEWVNLQAESATGRVGYALGYKKNLVLKALDGPGVEVEKWTLIGCMITKADYGVLDYATDDFQRIKITIQPDRCILSV